jgi:hypothetical protein
VNGNAHFPLLWAVRLSVSNKLRKSDAIGMPLPTYCAQREFMRGPYRRPSSGLPIIRFTRVVIASASFTLNDHIGQPSPINANNEIGLTVAATQDGRINSINLKCDSVVSGGINEAPFWIAFDNVQKNSALHVIFLRRRSRLFRRRRGSSADPRDTIGGVADHLQSACGWSRVLGLNPQTPFINATRQ